MKTAIAEPRYIDNSISQKILARTRLILMGLFRSKNGHESESGDLVADKVSVLGKRNLSIKNYANAIDQLAKFRAGIF